MNVNKIILIGRLGNEVVMKNTQSGHAIASFSIATSQNWKDKEGLKQQKTTWHNISCFGKLAEICAQYLRKGSACYIEGSYVSDKFVDKNGNERTAYSVKAETVQFLDTQKREARDDSDTSGHQHSQPQPQQSSNSTWTEDNIPF